MRQTKFTTNDCHHIFNRGTDKREIFSDDFDYRIFLLTMKISMSVDIGDMMKYRNLTRAQLLVFYQELSSGSKLVDIIVYCLNPIIEVQPPSLNKILYKYFTKSLPKIYFKYVKLFSRGSLK
jgi:hypothetical protein